jgi:hypothetical protein
LSNDPDKARAFFERALELEQVRMLPDSEWLNPMKKRPTKHTGGSDE